MNPIIQDTKKGALRYYKYNPEVGSLVNYGALAQVAPHAWHVCAAGHDANVLVQTWEHPDVPHSDTGVGGDNDPIDVLQINQ